MQENVVKEHISYVYRPELKEALYHSNPSAVDCETKFSKFSTGFLLFPFVSGLQDYRDDRKYGPFETLSVGVRLPCTDIKSILCIPYPACIFAGKLFFNFL